MSNTVQLTKTLLYKVLPNTPVSLSVVIGDGNVGGTSLIWDGTTIVQSSDEVSNQPIGNPGENVQGKLLICTTNVQDINPATNKTSVTYTLTGGAQPQDFPLQMEVSEAGDLAIYSVTFGFY